MALGCKCAGLLPCFRTDRPSDETGDEKIIKQFVNDDHRIALPAICDKTMQRKYQEMRLIFTPCRYQPATGNLFLQFILLIRSRSSSQSNSEKKQMNLLKVQATEESPLHSIGLYFPDPSAKLTISLDFNSVLD